MKRDAFDLPAAIIVFTPPLMRKPETWSCAHCFHGEQHGGRALTKHRKLCVPLASTQTFTPPCIHIHNTCAHINTRACTHACMNTLQVNTRDILVLHKWRDYSRIPRCTWILIFPPCWIYLSNSSLSLCGRQQLLWDMMPCASWWKRSNPLSHQSKKYFPFLKRMQYTCCNNITDNQCLIHGNSAGMSRSWLIALYFTLSHQCILFEGICWLSPPSDSGFYPFFNLVQSRLNQSLQPC